MAISYSILPIAILASVVLIVLLPFSWIQKRKSFRENAVIFQKLHPHKQQIIEAIQQAERKTTATFENIIGNLKKRKSQAIGEDELLKNLAELEELGLIQTKIVNKQDDPVFVWKTQFFGDN